MNARWRGSARGLPGGRSADPAAIRTAGVGMPLLIALAALALRR